ncbi:hypothetical protein [Nocardia suismassiliense]|uniref:hypothetical protein n=1 Tax=Nocardia suismassiliense TaxID=2077092 RepID=UPI000D1E437F|nr:hypothetical protein [Nocardia suismassiliense]
MTTIDRASHDQASSLEATALIGPVRCYPQILRVAAELASSGHQVLPPIASIVGVHLGPLTDRIDRLQRHLIDLADRVLVVTDEHCVYDQPTRDYVDYALASGKDVTRHRRSADSDQFDATMKVLH